MPSFKDALVKAVYFVAYYVAILCLGLSRLPALGRLFDVLGTEARLKVVTVAVDRKIQSTSAVLPFDAVARMVAAASYVAIAETCLCREARRCKDYPVAPGCIYLGEGARSIRLKAREASKEEALEWLKTARSLGLVTNVIWSSVELMALGADAARAVEVCSCCPCCCLMFKTRDASKAYLESILGFGVCRVVDAEACSRCANCERACPFRAITVDAREGPRLDGSRCKGCGRCETVCPANVLKVFPKECPGHPVCSSPRGEPNVDALMERFLDMVR